MSDVTAVPVISIAIDPKRGTDREKLSRALRELTAEDPTVRAETDERTGRSVIAGVGELHLEIVLQRICAGYRVEAAVGAPRVVYKQAGSVLLEPWMRLEVTTPSEQLPSVLHALAKRRCDDQSEESRNATRIVRARVPFSRMIGFAGELRDRTFGRATFSLQFESYQPVDDGPGIDDTAIVGAPLEPGPKPKIQAIALPEPDDARL